MKIKIFHQKPENKYLIPFIKFYLSSRSQTIEELEIECPDVIKGELAPDYFISKITPKIAIEVKRVVDESEVYIAKVRNNSVKRVQKILDELVKKEKKLKGIYYLQYPWFFKIKRGKEKIIAQKIIDAIKNNIREINIGRVGIFKVMTIDRPQNQNTQIILIGSVSPVMSINPPKTIFDRIAIKIDKANKQLSKKREADKKILLLVNQYFWGEKPEYFFEALSYCYYDLLKYNYIDEIWLQIESATTNFFHLLLYKKSFFISFEKGKIQATTQEDIELFERWFYPLSKLENGFKEKLFFALKDFLKNKKPHEVFKNKFAREEMVRIGIWLAEKNRFNDVVWVIDKFIDDTDPEEPEKYSGDPKFNYHQQIVNGEEPTIISTVLGHLAWVVQKLSTQKHYIVKALGYTKKLLSHKNLYVKLQAIIPLIEIAARRKWLNGWGTRPKRGSYREFHNLVFRLLKLIAENPNYKAIARLLCNVFHYYKDLSTGEAKKVLNVLKITEESASLFVYFSIFRQEHYKDQPIRYDEEEIQKKLIEIINTSENKYQRLKERIVFYLWRALEEDKGKFEKIQQYIDLILQQPCDIKSPYQNEIYNHIERIIKDHLSEKPKVCINWYKLMLSKIVKVMKYAKTSRIVLLYTKEILENITQIKTQIKPQELEEIKNQLLFLINKKVVFLDPEIKQKLNNFSKY